MPRGSSANYTYDAVRRLTRIAQKLVLERSEGNASGGTLLQMDYTYTADDLPAAIVEYDPLGMPTAVVFEYDKRRRLIHEMRTPSGNVPGYDIAYEYDDGRNRTKKIDNLGRSEIRYHYDLENPATYGSKNNRLMFYKEFDTTQPGAPGDPGALLSTTWYYYFYGEDGKNSGSVERVVTKRVASATYESTFFAYAKNGRTVTHVVGEQWNDDGLTACFPLQTHGYINTFGWEYRYDGARARYAARALQAGRLHMYLDPKKGWSDYNGDEIYADFDVNASGPPTTDRRFEPGIGRADSAGSGYYHTDHLGTIRGVTNASSAWSEPMAFTAFGERVVGTQNSTSTRFMALLSSP